LCETVCKIVIRTWEVRGVFLRELVRLSQMDVNSIHREWTIGQPIVYMQSGLFDGMAT